MPMDVLQLQLYKYMYINTLLPDHLSGLTRLVLLSRESSAMLLLPGCHWGLSPTSSASQLCPKGDQRAGSGYPPAAVWEGCSSPQGQGLHCMSSNTGRDMYSTQSFTEIS